MLLYGKLRYHVFTLSMNIEDYHPQHAVHKVRFVFVLLNIWTHISPLRNCWYSQLGIGGNGNNNFSIYSKLHAEALATVTGVFHTRDLKRQLCKNVTRFFFCPSFSNVLTSLINQKMWAISVYGLNIDRQFATGNNY